MVPLPCDVCASMNCECSTGMQVWRLDWPHRPWTTNAERAGNRYVRAKLTREWRLAYKLLAINAKVPPLQWGSVVAQPTLKGGKLQDTAACNPAVKAAIDGIVDAGVLMDDSSEYLRTITFLPPVRGESQLTIWLRGLPA